LGKSFETAALDLDAGQQAGCNPLGSVAKNLCRRLIGCDIVQNLVPQHQPAIKMLGVEAADGNMLEHGIAAKPAGLQRHRGPEVLHPGKVRRPVGDMGFEYRAEHRVTADGTVESLDQIGNQSVIDAPSMGLRGLFRSGAFGIAWFGHDLDSVKMYFICTVYAGWQLNAIYDIHLL